MSHTYKEESYYLLRQSHIGQILSYKKAFRNTDLNMQFAYKIRTAVYVLLSVTAHWTFQRLFITSSRNCSLLEIEKNKTKCRQIDFKTFTSNPEVYISREIFIVQKWSNQVPLSFAYHVQIK